MPNNDPESGTFVTFNGADWPVWRSHSAISVSDAGNCSRQGEAMGTHTYVREIASLRISDAEDVGGKGANLGELVAAELPVPGGFGVGQPGRGYGRTTHDSRGRAASAVGVGTTTQHRVITFC
jgi:hypothetical protein